MTTAPEVRARRAARDAFRDDGWHTDVRPGTGPDSTVSPQAMTERAYQVAAATGGPRQPSGVSSDLATSFKAGTVPRSAQGQEHNAAGNGERPSTGTQANQSRGTDRGGQGI
jgi:hypothetical protein